MTKRILAILLSALMALSAMPTAFAEETAASEPENSVAEEVPEEDSAPEATEEPTAEPTVDPTTEPTPEPTAEPTAEPVPTSTPEPKEESAGTGKNEKISLADNYNETSENNEDSSSEAEYVKKGTLDQWLNYTIDNTGKMIIWPKYSSLGFIWGSAYVGVQTFNPGVDVSSVEINGIDNTGYFFFSSNDCFKNLKEVKLDENVTCVSYGSFIGLLNLATVEMPSVTEISNRAFEECTGLSNISLPSCLEKICNEAFSDCSSLKSITIPDSVTSIGDAAFYRSGLESVELSKNLTEIPYQCFARCENLTNITLPEGITSIGRNAFSDCSSLKSITIPDSVTSIGDAAFYRSGLESVELSKNLTEIPYQCFARCENLTNITLPEGITSIGRIAFVGCSALTSITIPRSVTSIGNNAFFGCDNLKDVHYEGTEEEWGKITIGSDNESLKVATMSFHEHDYEKTIIKEPTCTEEGTAKWICKTCGDGYSDSVEPKDHSWVLISSKPATTLNNGHNKIKCSVCSKTNKTTYYQIKEVKLTWNTTVYSGNTVHPWVKITDIKGNELKKGTDYTVKYPDSYKVGKYYVKVTFKGKYSGTETLKYYIKPQSTSITSLKNGSKSFSVNLNLQKKQTSGYQIQYSTSKDFSSPVYYTIFNNKTSSATIKNLKSKKIYYVRVRTYGVVDGKKYYSSWSSTRYVKTK